jgi:hypothetical protein
MPQPTLNTATGCRPAHRPSRRSLLALALLPPWLGACATLGLGEPPRVDLVGLGSLPGQGLELRFLAKLRLQNPNSEPLAFDGVSLELDLRGQRFASGVAPLSGQVAGFSETVLEVPVTVSGFTIARQVLDLLRQAQGDAGLERVTYELRGRLGGAGLGGTAFSRTGEIDLSGLAR